MLVRVIALLLAVMIVGAAPHVLEASEVASAVDEVPDLTPGMTDGVVVAWPDPSDEGRVDAPRSHSRGRTHTSFVFRPPRVVASR